MWEEVPVAVAPRVLGQRMSANASLARARAILGDRTGAQQAFAQAESLLPSLRSSPGWSWFGSMWQAMIERSRAHISVLEGKHAQAEAGFRKAIAFMDQYIEHLPNLLRDPRFSLAPLSHSVRLAANWESDQLAFALLEQGKFAEAELSARNGLKRALLYSRDWPASSSSRAAFRSPRFFPGRQSTSTSGSAPRRTR